MTFYNTIGLDRQALLKAGMTTLNQNQKILRYFIQQGNDYQAAPSAICEKVFGDAIPVTSVRRAMTTLTTDGHLEKSPVTVVGPYGKPEHLWQLAPRWRGEMEQGSLL